MNPYLYGFWPGGYQGGQGYVGEDPNAAAAKAALAKPGMNMLAQLPPQFMQQFQGPQQFMAPPQQVPVHPAAFGRMPPPWWFSNTGTAPFDPRDFAQDLPTKINTLVLPLGNIQIAAGAIGTLQATIQRAIRFKKIILAGELTGANIVSVTANGDNLTAGGGVFPAVTYNKLDELDNISSDLYTSGATVQINVQNTTGAAITISGAIRGDTAR